MSTLAHTHAVVRHEFHPKILNIDSVKPILLYHPSQYHTVTILYRMVCSGAMNSTVAIVGTASTGISLLSGDAEYVRKRAIKRQRNRANRGGIVDGILDGSESFISGITSGIGGLVTKPFEEVSGAIRPNRT
jgi:hypothetical protein